MRQAFDIQQSAAQRGLRIGFLDLSGWDFHALTPDSAPLGGTQSALCYLARALARRGHEVYMATLVSVPGDYGGVHCRYLPAMTATALRALKLDVCVCVLGVGAGTQVREAVEAGTRVVLWTAHAADQKGVQELRRRDELEAYDGFMFVSQWQADGFAKAFRTPRERMAVVGYGMAPAFENMYPAETRLAARKAVPPVLAYTSTPFRGLDLLLEAFPRIRSAIPGARLRVFSSMKVYRVSAEEDQARYGGLYDRCRRMEGVEYVGSVGQGELARHMREAAFLAYPNTFAETFCIAAMEALAAGCQVVSSRLGALPETA